MANIVDYVKDYERYTFFEKGFNEVDAAILSAISYIDFNNIVSDVGDEITLGVALDVFLKNADLKKFLKLGIFQKDILKLAKVLKDAVRYKGILLSSYIYDVTFDKQFSAMTMKLPTKEKVIAFEGTDHNLVGWEEDFAMCYKFPVPADVDAVKYVNKNVSLFDGNVYVIGHSKGGHLAMVSAMMCNPFLKFKIKKVYNLDGPGFRYKEFNSRKCKRMFKKTEYIVPNYSIVGLFLRHPDNLRVVKSFKKDIYAHSMFSWEVREDSFVLETLSKLSKNLDESIIIWLEGHNDNEREKIVKDVFNYLRKSGIENVWEMSKLKYIISLIKNNKELDSETKLVLRNFIKFNIDYHLQHRSDNIEIK